MRQIVAIFWAGAIAALLWQNSPIAAQQGPQNPNFLADAGNPAQGLQLSKRSSSAGLVTFGRAQGGGVTVNRPASARASERALAFIAEHAQAFGLRSPADVRMTRESALDQAGTEHVRFQQVVDGVPVTAGELVVHLRGNRVFATNSEVLTDTAVNVFPTLQAAEAVMKAQELMARRHDAATAAELQYSEPRLELLNRSLLEDGTHPTRLTWFVEASALAARDFIWVDAHSGAIVLQFDALMSARNRKVYTANNTNALPGTLVRSEGGAPTGDNDVNTAYDYSGDTYDYYFNQHGRDSYDNAGATLTSTVRYCPDFFNCPFGNAFWNGTQMVYGESYPTSDDVDAHELTHAVTERSAGLFYYMQSGALNESFSDIFGETVDLTNGHGTDTAGVRWLMGEDLPASIGAIRNMMNPTVFGDPGKMSDPQFHTDYSTDGGGVHSNSGIPNHAYALMVDGGTYNGRTVTGIGLTAAGKIQYRALTTYLTSGSNFLDDYNALQQSCTDLIGTSGITANTCLQVKTALEAVEINLTYPGNTPAPAFCSAGQTPTNLFSDNFESSPNANWSKTALQGSGLWVVPDTGWAKSGTRMGYGEDFASTTDTVMAMTSSVALPAGAKLQFNHAYSFEQGFNAAYDGGVIEYSTNGGASWNDAGPLIVAGDIYDPNVTLEPGNPLAGRHAFAGESYGYTASQLNLSSLAGTSVRFRFRVGTDPAVGSTGWAVDDVRIYTCGSSCTFQLTPTSASFTAAGGSNSVAVTASSGTCGWTAVSNAAWITINSGTPGNGNGTVQYTVAANGGAQRTGTMTIAGQTFTVTQAAASGTPATVSVTAPNGGEKLYTGTPYTIQWSAANATSFDVASSTDGVVFNAVPGCTGLSGAARSCTWNAPGPVTSTGRIRVTAQGATGPVSDVSDATFSIASGAATISVTFPNSGNVGIGSLQQVKWSHNLGAQSFVKIELSRDGGLTYPEVLTPSLKNTAASAGTFNWRVTGPATSGAQARVRVTWTNGPTSDTSNSSFTIAPAFIKLTTPATGSSWGFGTTQKQTWTTNLGALDNVNVQLSTTGIGGPYSTMTGGANIVATNKTANVLVPTTATTTARVKVVWANPPAGFSAAGDNPGNFKLEAPFVTLTSPTAGQLWHIGTAQTIAWNNNLGLVEKVEIRLSKDGGATFPTVIVASTPSDGKHPVTVNAAWGSQATTRIKVTWVASPGVNGQTANFTIQP